MIDRNVCICQWSTVNTTTIDPPHIVWVDPFRHFHGLRAVDLTDEDYERGAEDAQRKRRWSEAASSIAKKKSAARSDAAGGFRCPLR
jgi:hypothetical protein